MNDKASHVIDRLGGTAQVSRLCGLSMQAVSNWRRNGIPKSWAKYLHEVSQRHLPEKQPAVSLDDPPAG